MDIPKSKIVEVLLSKWNSHVEVAVRLTIAQNTYDIFISFNFFATKFFAIFFHIS